MYAGGLGMGKTIRSRSNDEINGGAWGFCLDHISNGVFIMLDKHPPLFPRAKKIDIPKVDTPKICSIMQYHILAHVQ